MRINTRKLAQGLVLYGAMSVAACNGAPGTPGLESTILGIDVQAGPVAKIPSDNGVIPPGTKGTPELGPGCRSDDANKICLGLKMVAYRDPASDAPVLSEAEALSNLATINGLYTSCNIAFQIDDYEAIRATDVGLQYATANYPELDDIRGTLSNDHTLLVAHTGLWNRGGSLGSTGANAWTTLPNEGGGPFGAILEAAVASAPNIAAHEIGHYLNLDHMSDTSNIMNPVIYSSSTAFNSGQCAAARSAAKYFWAKMMR